jgi:hypothetical protein
MTKAVITGSDVRGRPVISAPGRCRIICELKRLSGLTGGEIRLDACVTI